MIRNRRSRAPLMEQNENIEDTRFQKNINNSSKAMKRSITEVNSNGATKRAKYFNAEGMPCLQNCFVLLTSISLKQWTDHENKINNVLCDMNEHCEDISDICDKVSFAKVLDLFLKGMGKQPYKIIEDSSISPIQRFGLHTQDILNKYNYDMKARLDIDYTPICCNDIELCVKQHGKQANNCDKMADYLFSQMFSSYLKGNNYQSIMDFLTECIIDKKKCPDVGVMLKVFELILNMQLLPDEEHNLADTLQYFVDIFDLLILEHPPHAHYMMRYYKSLLSKPLLTQNENFDPRTKYDRCSGIFHFTLRCLEEEFKVTSPEGPLIEPVYEDNNEDFLSMSELDLFENLYINDKVPKKVKLIYLYETLNRGERIHRIFTLLKIFVKIFEVDIAFFTLIYGDDLEKMVNKSAKPVLVELLWPNPNRTTGHKGGFMNATIRRIIELFINSVKFQLPEIYIETLRKLFSVVVHSVNIHEPNSRRVFPYVNVLTNCLVIEVTTALRAENPDTMLKVLQIMKPAFLRSSVIDNLLKTITSVKMKSISSYYVLLKEEKYLQFKKHIPSNTMTNSNYCPPDDNYDNLIMLLKKITQKHFLQILYLAITSYIECYKIHDFNSNLISETIMCLEVSTQEPKSKNSDSKHVQITKPSQKYNNKRDLKIFAQECSYNLRKRKRPSIEVKENATESIDFVNFINTALNKNEIAAINQLQNDVDITAEIYCNYYRRCRMLQQFSKYCDRTLRATQ